MLINRRNKVDFLYNTVDRKSMQKCQCICSYVNLTTMYDRWLITLLLLTFHTLFSGLNLLDIIDILRNEDDEELVIQCNVFDDEKQDDDEAFNALNPVGVDINDHNAVYNALFEKVMYGLNRTSWRSLRYTNFFSFGEYRRFPTNM